MRAASTIVPAILTALALSGCVPMRQDRSYQPWPTTTLSRRELQAAKNAVAPIVATHVFDWNTVSARRHGKLLHVTVAALPEPQADGAVFEPLANCFGASADWDCDVRIDRSLYALLEVRGTPQRVAVRIADGIDAAEAAALVRQAFEVSPEIGGASECGVPGRSGGETITRLQDAFAARAIERSLRVGRHESRTYVRSENFNLNFERIDGEPPRYGFVCWSDAPILVTS